MNGGAVLCLFLMYTFYIPVNMFLAYALSFMFNTYDTAQTVIPNIFFFVSTVLIAKSLILSETLVF